MHDIEHVHDYQQMENGKIINLNRHGMEVHGRQQVNQQVQVHIINEHQWNVHGNVRQIIHQMRVIQRV